MATYEILGTNDLTVPTSKTITTQDSPSIGNNMGSVNATIAGILNQANAIQTQINEMSNAAKEQQIQASKQTESTGKSGVWDKIQGLIGQRQETQANQKSTEDIVNESMAKFGLTPETYQAMQGMIGQLSAFSAQMADLETKKQNAMDIIGNKSVDERYITQEQAVVAKRYDSQIASVSAQAGTVAYTLQLQQGLVKDAKETANMVIDAMTYDQKQKVADMDWAISTYSDLYDAMGKEEQQQWDNAHQIAQDEYQKARDEADRQLRGIGGGAPATQGDYYWDTATKTWKSISGEGGLIKSVKDDIAQAITTGLVGQGKQYNTREDLINTLATLYYDVPKDQIAAQVYAMIPDVKTETKPLTYKQKQEEIKKTEEQKKKENKQAYTDYLKRTGQPSTWWEKLFSGM